MTAPSAKSTRLLLLVFWISTLPLIGGCGLFERDSVFGGLSGVVLDKETGKPIEGAVVFIHWQLEEVSFEIYPGPTVYWSETTTDKNGRFKFDDSVPKPVKLSMQLRMRERAPAVGVSKDGYGFYVNSIGHIKSGIFQRMYSPKRDRLEIELVESTVEEVLSHYSLTLRFLTELEAIVYGYRCEQGKIPKTMAQLKMLLKKAANYNKKIGSHYYHIDNFVKFNTCDGA